MLFRLCDHYENNLPIYKQEGINECFICFEYKNEHGSIPIYLNSQNLYLNACVCNGSVHNECLKFWFDKNKKCPICRIKVIENNKATVIIYNYIPFGMTIYIYTKKLVPAVIRVVSCVLLIFLVIDFYFMILNNKYRQYNTTGYNDREYDVRQYNHIEYNVNTYTMSRVLSHILDEEYIE
jgi:hypothetical protein